MPAMAKIVTTLSNMEYCRTAVNMPHGIPMIRARAMAMAESFSVMGKADMSSFQTGRLVM